ncbi:MAG: hypothetical protein KUG78_02240 [Kangiellaceae bacterium]|nr:hypothetical protein [Kangiellaceae bacterium]
MSNESVTANDILQGHTQATIDRTKNQPVVLVAQDTTFTNLTTEVMSLHILVYSMQRVIKIIGIAP